MKKLASNLIITLFSHTYQCDLYLGLYSSSGKPALFLTDSETGEPIATATCNPPPGFLIGFPIPTFCWKNWSENEGLQAQLEGLRAEDDSPLFEPLLRRDKTRMAITLGYTKAELSILSGVAEAAYNELREQFYKAGQGWAEPSTCPHHTPIL